MVNMRFIDVPAFEIIGKKTWIDGPDNEAFGRFWQQCRADGFLDVLNQIKEHAGMPAGPQTGAAMLGVSRVERDPAKRDFLYMIAIETPSNALTTDQLAGMERYTVPAARWAVFECHGQVPDSIVTSEMYAFMEWLPSSGYQHAHAPEMEVYPAGSGADYCEFWLPVEPNQS